MTEDLEETGDWLRSLERYQELVVDRVYKLDKKVGNHLQAASGDTEANHTVREIDELAHRNEGRITALENRYSQQRARQDYHQEKIDGLKERIEKIERAFKSKDYAAQQMRKQLVGLGERVESLEHTVAERASDPEPEHGSEDEDGEATVDAQDIMCVAGETYDEWKLLNRIRYLESWVYSLAKDKKR